MKINANEIRVGMLIEYKSDLWEVLKIQHVKPGKGGAFNQVEMKSINSGTKINERFRSSESVEKATVEEDKFSFIYKDKEEFVFMNSKSYEQVTVGKNVIGEKEKMLSENLEVVISFYEEKPIQIELPNQINSEVKETEMAIKGQTVSSSYKPAILNNGLKIQVPPFINIGDKIIIDTRTLEYLKKV
ncbi:elongation factor P [Candidatus Pelagibacter sp.]|nr:elongation factor P [Candidatus Pelagibacter sp.]